MVEKRSVSDTVFNLINYTFFILFTLICVFPFYYLFINTISDNGLVAKGLINFYPRGFNLKNYYALKNVNGLGTAFLVTLARTLIGTALSTAVSGFCGYLVIYTIFNFTNCLEILPLVCTLIHIYTPLWNI